MFLTVSETDAVSKHFEKWPITLFLSGSYQDGNETAESDIDLVAIDPNSNSIRAKKIVADGRKIDLIVFPSVDLNKLLAPQKQLDKPILSYIECAVLNAMNHGKLIVPHADNTNVSNFSFEGAIKAMIEAKLYLVGASTGSLKRQILRGDEWGVLLMARQIVDAWTDAWLAVKGYFVAKPKWRIRFLRSNWVDFYRSYLSVQFPVDFLGATPEFMKIGLKRLYDYLNEAPITGTQFDKKAAGITKEVHDVIYG